MAIPAVCTPPKTDKDQKSKIRQPKQCAYN